MTTEPIDLEPSHGELLNDLETQLEVETDPKRRKALHAVVGGLRDGELSKKAAYTALIGAPNGEIERYLS